MKIGTENRKEVIAATVLGVIAIVFLGQAFLWKPEPAQGPATAKTSKSTKKLEINSLDPTLQLDLLKASEDVKYEGNGRNIFRAQAEPLPKPLASPLKNGIGKEIPAAPPKPAGPPPINLRFFGFESRPGHPQRIFLSQGEDVFVASEGDVVKRRYKVVKILKNAVEIEDMLNNTQQTIPLTQG